jgi:hypothetical protein
VKEAPGQDYAIVLRLFHHLQMRLTAGTLEQQQGMTNQGSEPSSLWKMSQRAEEERIYHKLVDEEHGQIREQEHK